MNILVKFPTRSRPALFLKTLQGYMDNAVDNSKIHYMISVDEDDQSMQGASLHGLLSLPNVSVHSGYSASKIIAINRDLHKAPEWDILVLASDDMICVHHGWDSQLRSEMTLHFPDTDGALFHWDGDPATARHNEGKGLCTMCILGRKYFERFNYIYHPSYKSLWCDNEQTEVAQQLGKMFKSDLVLFKHDHFSNNGSKPDKLMIHTQSYYKEDEANYYKRKSTNFGI